MITTGLAWLRDRMMASEGVMVTYTQTGGGASQLMMIPTAPEASLDGEDGIQTGQRRLDFRALPADFDTQLPAKGDKIDYDGVRYIVSGRVGQAPWEYSDAHRVMIRIYTVEAGTP